MCLQRDLLAMTKAFASHAEGSSSMRVIAPSLTDATRRLLAKLANPKCTNHSIPEAPSLNIRQPHSLHHKPANSTIILLLDKEILFCTLGNASTASVLAESWVSLR